MRRAWPRAWPGKLWVDEQDHRQVGAEADGERRRSWTTPTASPVASATRAGTQSRRPGRRRRRWQRLPLAAERDSARVRANQASAAVATTDPPRTTHATSVTPPKRRRRPDGRDEQDEHGERDPSEERLVADRVQEPRDRPRTGFTAAQMPRTPSGPIIPAHCSPKTTSVIGSAGAERTIRTGRWRTRRASGRKGTPASTSSCGAHAGEAGEGHWRRTPRSPSSEARRAAGHGESRGGRPEYTADDDDVHVLRREARHHLDEEPALSHAVRGLRPGRRGPHAVRRERRERDGVREPRTRSGRLRRLHTLAPSAARRTPMPV